MFERPLLPRRIPTNREPTVEWGNHIVTLSTYRRALVGVVVYRLFGREAMWDLLERLGW